MATNQQICEAVSEVTGIDASAIRGKSRVKHVLKARQIAMFIMRSPKRRPSLKDVGRYFGRHHSTVINSVQVVQNEMELYPELLETVEKVRSVLKT